MRAADDRFRQPIFRDREFWRTLEEILLPDLVAKQTAKIKVWSAGCAGGDEVYSFKIVWDLLKKKYRDLPRLELLATDMNSEHLNRARSGIYSGSSLKELSPESQSLYFEKIAGKNLYAVKALLGQGVVWRIHHLLSDPPDANFDIIFLRNNILTYYRERPKKKAFNNVLESLAPCGILVLGSHETVPLKQRTYLVLNRILLFLRKKLMDSLSYITP